MRQSSKSIALSITASAAYSAGKCVGGLKEVAGAVIDKGAAGVLVNLTLVEHAASLTSPALKIFLFDAEPAALADNGTPAFVADVASLVGVVSVATTDWVSNGNGTGVANPQFAPIVVRPTAGTSIWAVIVAGGTAFANATPVNLRFGILQD